VFLFQDDRPLHLIPQEVPVREHERKDDASDADNSVLDSREATAGLSVPSYPGENKRRDTRECPHGRDEQNDL